HPPADEGEHEGDRDTEDEPIGAVDTPRRFDRNSGNQRGMQAARRRNREIMDDLARNPSGLLGGSMRGASRLRFVVRSIHACHPDTECWTRQSSAGHRASRREKTPASTAWESGIT